MKKNGVAVKRLLNWCTQQKTKIRWEKESEDAWMKWNFHDKKKMKNAEGEKNIKLKTLLITFTLKRNSKEIYRSG